MPELSPDLTLLTAAVHKALEAVIDPEIRRPITDLKMVRSVTLEPVGESYRAVVGLDLTTEGCPMKADLVGGCTRAALTVPEITDVRVELGVMSPTQREDLRVMLRGSATPEIPFNKPGSLTRIYAVASGKGGVGKSTVTANLAAAMAKDGLKVGVLDADIYGFSIPRLLGVTTQPTRVDSMLLPPIAHEIKVVSIGMFVPAGQPVVWRGPMLHRALEQFLTDVFWGDLDVLLLDLPPGTGDIAISVAQLLPNSVRAKGGLDPWWNQGWTYLADFAGPYRLVVPAVAVVVLLCGWVAHGRAGASLLRIPFVNRRRGMNRSAFVSEI